MAFDGKARHRRGVTGRKIERNAEAHEDAGHREIHHPEAGGVRLSQLPIRTIVTVSGDGHVETIQSVASEAERSRLIRRLRILQGFAE